MDKDPIDTTYKQYYNGGVAMAPIPYGRLRPLERPDLSPTPNPSTHSLCQDELNDLFPNQGEMALLKEQMNKRVKYWFLNRQEALNRKDWFEHVGSVSEGGTEYPIYSLRFNGVRALGNLRILYIMDGSEMILMHAFQEKRGRAYQHAKDIVTNRLRRG